MIIRLCVEIKWIRNEKDTHETVRKCDGRLKSETIGSGDMIEKRIERD